MEKFFKGYYEKIPGNSNAQTIGRLVGQLLGSNYIQWSVFRNFKIDQTRNETSILSAYRNLFLLGIFEELNRIMDYEELRRRFRDE